jgi:spore maturation protein CgeB
MAEQLNIVFLGLSITSSWGNGHATTYRGLVRELSARGHEVLFLERDVPWYAENRDLSAPPFCRTMLYKSLQELKDLYAYEVRRADLCAVGSYTPEGIAVCEWVTDVAEGVTSFYDIDTPVTLAKLAKADCEYLRPDLISRFDLYLSFTGGPTLRRLEREYGSPMAKPLYCSVDSSIYSPTPEEKIWDLGYMGTYSGDRQAAVDNLLTEPARSWNDGRFVVAGPQYPRSIQWPRNVERIEHLSPGEHSRFYNRQRYTLNVTRSDMIAAGFSPSVRLFEAAACATPIISDYWEGLDDFFRVGREILVARDSREVLQVIREMPENERGVLGERARRRVLAEHTSARRAEELEGYVYELMSVRKRAFG